VRGLTNFIEKKFLSSKGEREISLKVDGKKIPLTPFVKGFLMHTVKGMLMSLKACDKPNRIKIDIEEDKE
jgi:hypothetical protein